VYPSGAERTGTSKPAKERDMTKHEKMLALSRGAWSRGYKVTSKSVIYLGVACIVCTISINDISSLPSRKVYFKESDFQELTTMEIWRQLLSQCYDIY